MHFAILFACFAAALAAPAHHGHAAYGATHGAANYGAANHGANYAANQYGNQNYGAQSAGHYGEHNRESYGSSDLESVKDHYAVKTTHDHDKGAYYAADGSYNNGASGAQYGAAHGHTQDAGHAHAAHGSHHGHGHGHGAAAYGTSDTAKYAATDYGSQYGANNANYNQAAHSQAGGNHDRAKDTHSEVRDHEYLKTHDDWGEKEASKYGGNTASNYGASAYGADQAGAHYGANQYGANAYGTNHGHTHY